MTLKEKRLRAALVHEIHTYCMKKLYEAQQRKKLIEMGKIAQENQVIRKGTTPTFIYEDKWYSFPYDAVLDRDKRNFNRILDNSFKNKVKQIMHPTSTEDFEIGIYAKNYIGNCLAICRTLPCLKSLLYMDLPEADFRISNMETIFCCGDPLTQEEIDRFKTENQKGERIVKGLFMLELLLSGI